eukprot:Protomagalhaensia_sp_Gyna_25__1042@NODE_1501_length_1782_cov_7_814687_g1216_i0_p1_GENE_NODE_1501_length_1782_cov_7_814687_g1216_i0NODE_1501_length_1782_cov_7_814687_g1216_i0_p1_ORF_typecomplete_len443_score77_15DUF2838/PF10998_8/6_4e34DUF2838/PF10998_8/7e03DUF2838/PF10998_8/4_8e03YdjC/PF04794_12/0_18_NODE_1501_length_1782_cov_7_814687_g1216_i02541582
MLAPMGFEDFEPGDDFGDPGIVGLAASSFDGGLSPSYVEAVDNFFAFLSAVQSNLVEELRQQSDKFKDSIRRLRHQQLEARLRRQLSGFKRQLANPPVVAIRQKVSFFLGVSNVVLAAFAFGRIPFWMPQLYALDYLLLYALRVWIYRRRGWQYFTLDLCYWANTLLLLLIFVWPHGPHLLGGVVGLALGPVAWAILQWRNSLVFHSLDKITSCFIHFCPTVVLFVLRWWPNESEAVASDGVFSVSQARKLIRQSQLGWREIVGPTVALYLVWQLMYYVFVNIRQREKVEKGKRMTSYTWLMRSGATANSSLFKVVNVFGPSYRLLVYMGLQLFYTLLTVLPVPFLWRSATFHGAIILFLFFVCAWNGATYYVDVFSHSYARTITRIHDDLLKNTIPDSESERDSEASKCHTSTVNDIRSEPLFHSAPLTDPSELTPKSAKT